MITGRPPSSGDQHAVICPIRAHQAIRAPPAATTGHEVRLPYCAPVRISIGDISVGFSSQRGGFVDAVLPASGFGLTRSVELNVALGPILLTQADLSLQLDAPGSGGLHVRASAGIALVLSLGPVRAALSSPGGSLSLDLSGDRPGELFSYDFVPPLGAAISIDAGVIAGGGFIGYDPALGRYFGVLELRAQQLGINAMALIETRLPSGAPGYAVLVVLRATFPAIQIGFGFALTAVGGLLALNRQVDVDALRARFARGPPGGSWHRQDPVRNAPALLADLDAVFPVAPGITVVGPTVQLLWAGLVHLDVGVFIELPGPARVVLLGSAHAEIERDGRAYLSIRVDIVGVVDLRAETAAFDAVLIDSHLMGMLDLTGGAAFRLSWGAQPYAVLSLGGFNPAYHPEPLSFPATLTRIAMVHGKPSDELYLRFEGYFAITSNTLQFGASVEALIHSGGFIVHGTVGFDALIQFDPVPLPVRHPRVGDRRLPRPHAGRPDPHRLAHRPGPGGAAGEGLHRAAVLRHLLLRDVHARPVDRRRRSRPPPTCWTRCSPNWPTRPRLRAAGAPDPHVRLRPPDPSLTTPVVAPTGTLVWEQQRAPLDLLLTRVGGTPLPAPAQVSATSIACADRTRDRLVRARAVHRSDRRPGADPPGV